MRHFDNWLKAYMIYTRDSESPQSYHFWTGVATIAGALRRRVWIDMKKFKWTPNFYIIFVGPAGIVAKSTSSNIGMKLLRKVPEINFGPESMTWQGLAEAFKNSAQFVRFTALDGSDTQTQMSALTIQVSELGTFLTPDDDKLISFLIRMWDGQEDVFRHDTVMRGQTTVTNPWLNIIAATTPAWLQGNFPASMIGGGLTSRILFIYAERKRLLIPYPDEVIPDAEHAKLEAELIADLTEISKLSGQYLLSTDARAWGHDWYAKLHTDKRPLHLASDRYSGYIARKQTTLHKLAMVLTAARTSKLLIEREQMEEALTLIEGIEPDMIKVFESIGVVDEAANIHTLVSFVRNHGDLTSDELYRMCINQMSEIGFNAAIKAALRSNMLITEFRDGKLKLLVGNPTVH